VQVYHVLLGNKFFLLFGHGDSTLVQPALPVILINN